MPEIEAQKSPSRDVSPGRPQPSIRLPGMPEGAHATRICHGSLVGEQEFELHGKKITRGGRFASSAVVVVPKEGYTFELQKGGHYWPQKVGTNAPVA